MLKKGEYRWRGSQWLINCLWSTSYAKLLQLCMTLCDATDCSPPGSSVDGALQARILQWLVMPSSREPSRPRDQTHVSYVSWTGTWILSHYPSLGSPSIALVQYYEESACLKKYNKVLALGNVQYLTSKGSFGSSSFQSWQSFYFFLFFSIMTKFLNVTNFLIVRK